MAPRRLLPLLVALSCVWSHGMLEVRADAPEVLAANYRLFTVDLAFTPQVSSNKTPSVSLSFSRSLALLLNCSLILLLSFSLSLLLSKSILPLHCRAIMFVRSPTPRPLTRPPSRLQQARLLRLLCATSSPSWMCSSTSRCSSTRRCRWPTCTRSSACTTTTDKFSTARDTASPYTHARSHCPLCGRVLGLRDIDIPSRSLRALRPAPFAPLLSAALPTAAQD